MSKSLIGKIEPFWDTQYQELSYIKEPFNNKEDMKTWRQDGYKHPTELFTGMMCKHGNNHPDWTDKIVEWLEKDFGWKDVGVNFYRMETGVILPPHKDAYVQYAKMFDCKLHEIERVLLFLEDWKPGHYFELNKKAIMNYKAGCYAWWVGDIEHSAANIGKDYRYTLQLTGHKNANT